MDSDPNILDFAPKLKALTEDVLYADIWKRKELSQKERSLITIATLSVLGRLEQLQHHIDLAKENGVKENELTELFTHIAFYAGWPVAISGLTRLHHSKLENKYDRNTI
jgi:4-carboxymuconolactone decarboxylase